MSLCFNLMSSYFKLKTSYFNLRSGYFNLRVKRCRARRSIDRATWGELAPCPRHHRPDKNVRFALTISMWGKKTSINAVSRVIRQWRSLGMKTTPTTAVPPRKITLTAAVARIFGGDWVHEMRRVSHTLTNRRGRIFSQTGDAWYSKIWTAAANYHC